jgi:hypothetical protein
MKAITPMELVLSSLCTTNYNVDSNREERRYELEFVDEAREQVCTRMMEYQRRVWKVFDKHVAPRHFQKGGGHRQADWQARPRLGGPISSGALQP